MADFKWISLAHKKHSKGCKDMELNLKNISSLLNRRIKRMMDKCHSAKIIIFLYHNPSWNKFMLVGEKMMFLDDFSELQKTANNIFKSKVRIYRLLN